MMVAGFGLLGMFLWQSIGPPDIGGRWTGEGWGQVVLEEQRSGQYKGAYTDTFGEEPGKLEVKWSRIERRFNGTWADAEDRFGKISVRLVDDEIRGAWTTSKKSEINVRTPRLADLLWVRPDAESTKKTQVGVRNADKTELEGEWRLESIVGAGTLGHEEGLTARVRGNVWTMIRQNGEAPYRFALDTNVNPKTIDLISERKEPFSRLIERGIYRLEGDTLRVVYGPRPSIRATGGLEDRVHTWKRITRETAEAVGSTESLSKLLGIWRIASYTLNGKPLDVKAAKASISEDKMVFSFPNLDAEDQFGSIRYSIRGNEIDLLCNDSETDESFTLLGRYKVTGDLLWLAYHDATRMPERPQRATPDVPEGDVAYFRLERIAPNEEQVPGTVESLERLRDDEIAWGPTAEDGLQVGVHLAREADGTIPGDKFLPTFFFRNQRSTSTVTLEYVIAFEIDARTPTGDKLEVTELRGAILSGLPVFPTELKERRAKRLGHAFVVSTTSKKDLDAAELSPPLDRARPSAVVHADPGQRIRLRFRVPNYSDKSNDPHLVTGQIALTVGEEKKPPGTVDSPIDSSKLLSVKRYWRGKDALQLINALKPAWSGEQHGVQFGVCHVGNKRRFRAGERVPLAWFIRNVGDETIEVRIAADFLLNVPHVRDAHGGKVQIEQIFSTGTVPLYRERLKPGESFGFRHPGLGLGDNPHPREVTWHPCWAKPVAGVYRLSHTNSITVAALAEGSSPQTAKFTTGLIDFEVVGEDQVPRIVDSPKETLELLELVTGKGDPWVATTYYLETSDQRLFKKRSVSAGVTIVDVSDIADHPDVTFKVRLFLPHVSRRGADYVARNGVHLWVSKEELESVAEGRRFVRAFYYPQDEPKGSQRLKAKTLEPKAAQPKWLAETEELGDLIAVVEVTRGTKPVVTKRKVSDVKRLQGVWLLESEEQFGEIQAAHDPEQEPRRVVIEGHTLRGCFDAPWKPITWKVEFDSETQPQAIYLTSKVNDENKKRSVRFRLRDDQLELCFDRRNPNRLPVELRTAEGSNAIIWHLRRSRAE